MSFAVTPSVALNPWVQILAALEKKSIASPYDTWLKPTRYSYVRDRVIFVRIPTPEFRHVGDRYGDLIQEAIENLQLEFDDVQLHHARRRPHRAAGARRRRVRTELLDADSLDARQRHALAQCSRGRTAAGAL